MRFVPSSVPLQTRAALLSFVLTIGAAAAVFASGAGRRGTDFLVRNVEPEVAFFVVPTLAIVLAMFVLAARLAWRGSIPEAPGRRVRSLRWAVRRS
jgi:hypothetical protein